ncbi:MAG: hypothetical protein LBR73_04445 [Oscillospiraceae bacterium]|jgi:hypothetical protein|nr:hypothetical protein [Oscillospiraceae bacterium]
MTEFWDAIANFFESLVMPYVYVFSFIRGIFETPATVWELVTGGIRDIIDGFRSIGSGGTADALSWQQVIANLFGG